MSAFLGLWLSMGILRKPTMASYWYESQQTWLYNTPTRGFKVFYNRRYFSNLPVIKLIKDHWQYQDI